MNDMCEEELSINEELDRAESILSKINSCSCKIEVFNDFIYYLKKGDSEGEALSAAMYNWDEL